MIHYQPSKQSSTHIKRLFKPILALILLILLICLPIKMGEKSINQDLFLIGTLEKIAQNHHDSILTQISTAWAVTKLSSKIISLLQRGEISFTPLGMGITLAPGEILGVVGDNLDRISSYLFILMLLVLVEQFLLGFITFICLKILMPAAIILYLLSHFLHHPWLKNTGALLFKYALILWLFLPLSALISNYIQQGYMSQELNKNITQLTEQEKTLEELEKNAINPTIQDSNTSIWDKTKNMITSPVSQFQKTKEELSQKLYGLIDTFEQTVNTLMSIIAIFTIINILIPIATAWLLLLSLKYASTTYLQAK